MSVHVQNSRMTTAKLRQMKAEGEKIAMLTSYDFTLANLVDEAGVDVILVGDSASNVVCGNQYTLPITVEEMIFLTKGVVRAAKHALVVCDMPFGSYQVSEEEAVRNAIKILKERQSVNQFGGYGLRAKEEAEAAKLLHDAKLLDEAGCFSIVLEKIPAALAKKVTESVSCPVIGIGAGNACDGQVLVLHDMLGLTEGFKPKFLRHFANLAEEVKGAVGTYVAAVKDSSFPNAEESY